MSDVPSQSAAEVGRACRDVKNQFAACRCQLRDDPFQTPGGEALVGERDGLGTELFTHQVIMRAGHTDMLDSWQARRPNQHRCSTPVAEKRRAVQALPPDPLDLGQAKTVR